jgi:hypothetical protein
MAVRWSRRSITHTICFSWIKSFKFCPQYREYAP